MRLLELFHHGLFLFLFLCLSTVQLLVALCGVGYANAVLTRSLSASRNYELLSISARLNLPQAQRHSRGNPKISERFLTIMNFQ